MKLVKRLLAMAAVVVLLAIAAASTFYLHPLWVLDQTTRFQLWREGVKSEYVVVDGYRLHYFEDAPHGGGTPLVLVHGLGDRAEAWAPLMAQFAAAGFHVYALDMVGYGRSPKPLNVDYSISFEEKVVADFMHSLGITHADVCGWSLGGWVVLKLGMDHPELARRLVVYDAAGIYYVPDWEPGLFDPRDQAALYRLFSMLTPKPVNFPEFVGRDLLRKFAAGWPVVDQALISMRSGRDLLDFRLQSIGQPTLLVWGAKDALIPVQVGERMNHGIAGSQMVVVPGCGHLAPSQCTEPVVEATVKFLRAENRE